MSIKKLLYRFKVLVRKNDRKYVLIQTRSVELHVKPKRLIGTNGLELIVDEKHITE